MQYQDYLQAIAEGSAELENLLRRECELLSGHSDPDALGDLAARKATLTRKLNQMDAQRQRLEIPGNGPQLPEEIVKQLRRCHELNLRVGAHIAAQARYANRALEVLGLAAGASVYRADGSELAVTSGKNLGTA